VGRKTEEAIERRHPTFSHGTALGLVAALVAGREAIDPGLMACLPVKRARGLIDSGLAGADELTPRS
jgi:hypothetical protein